MSEPEAEEGAAFQDAARRAGVPTPGVVRGRDGEVLLAVGPGQLSVQTWVDLREPTRELDPVAIGSLVAALHLVPFAGRQPVHPWYRRPGRGGSMGGAGGGPRRGGRAVRHAAG